MRFALLCEGEELELWQSLAVQRLLHDDLASLSALVIDDAPRGKDPSGGIWSLIPQPSRARVSLKSALPNASRIVTLRAPGILEGSYPHSNDTALRQLELDFILYVGYRPLAPGLNHLSAYGSWRFRFGDPQRYPSYPPAFWEVSAGEPVTEATLYRLSDRPQSGIVLRSGRMTLNRYPFVFKEGSLLLEAAHWPAQVCKEIRAGVADCLRGPEIPMSIEAPKRPGNRASLRFVRERLRRRLERLPNLLFETHWNIGIADRSIEDFLAEGDLPRIAWLPSGDGRQFVADPMSITCGGRTAVLFESYDYARRLGSIYVRELQDGGWGPQVGPVLNTAVHESYPYPLEYAGELYCVPETSAKREIALYKCTSFPAGWSKAAVLIEGFAGLDSTIVKQDDTWWLFCTNEEDCPLEKLHLWSAPDLFGPWKPHPRNPVKVDCSSSRPAGTLFRHEGHWYRPAQDYSKGNSNRVALNRIVTLTPRDFEERTVAFVGPPRTGPYRKQFHTLAALPDGRTLVDASDRALTLWGLKQRLRRLRRTSVAADT